MLNENFVINLGFRSENLADFELERYQIGVFNLAKEHKREEGNIISGIFSHTENKSLILVVYSKEEGMFPCTYIKIGIFNEERIGIDYCFSLSMGHGISEDHNFLEETLKNYVTKHLKT